MVCSFARRSLESDRIHSSHCELLPINARAVLQNSALEGSKCDAHHHALSAPSGHPRPAYGPTARRATTGWREHTRPASRPSGEGVVPSAAARPDHLVDQQEHADRASVRGTLRQLVPVGTGQRPPLPDITSGVSAADGARWLPTQREVRRAAVQPAESGRVRRREDEGEGTQPTALQDHQSRDRGAGLAAECADGEPLPLE